MVNSARNDSDDLEVSRGVTASSSFTGSKGPNQVDIDEKMATRNHRNILQAEQQEPPKKGISIPMIAWIKNQIVVFDPNLFWQATRGSIPILVFFSMYQASAVADHFGPQMFLTAIVATLSWANDPRAKFFHNIFLSLVLYCIAMGISCLGLWCARQARLHTSSPGDTSSYNGSAAAVSAIFFFFNQFSINAFRARRPDLMVAIINYTIFTNACFTTAYTQPLTTPIWSFPKQFLINYLIAIGLALGVNVLIFPITSRTVFLNSYNAYLLRAKDLQKAYVAFLSPPYQLHETQLAKTVTAFRNSIIKMSVDESDAISEIAIGSLSPSEIQQLYSTGRKIAWPLVGIGKIADIVIKMRHGDMQRYNPMGITEENISKALSVLDKPCHGLNELCQEGIEHILRQLECGRYANSWWYRIWTKDRGEKEVKPDCMKPDFLAYFDAGLETFWQSRTDGLDQFIEDEKTNKLSHVAFIVIFNKFICCAVAQEVRNLIILVDTLRSQGSLSRRRLVVPDLRHISDKFVAFFAKSTSLGAGTYEPVNDFARRKQTSLQPTSYWSLLRTFFWTGELFLRFLRSHHALFGFRAALAAFTVAVPAYLESSEPFYQSYRGVWSTVVIVISLGPTTGGSINGLFFQCAGTTLGGLVSMAVWYMVDQKVAGVIVLSFVVTIFHLYFLYQDRRRIATVLNSFSTYVNVIGYALEVAKIGIDVETKTGQAYLPVYKLAPLRILVTIIGVFVSFLFTLIPIPVTSKDILRRDLGHQFQLLAKIFSSTQARLSAAVNYKNTEDTQALRDLLSKTSLQYLGLQNRSSQNLLFTSWEPNFRFQFPSEVYTRLLKSMQSLHDLYIIQNDCISRLEGSWLEAMVTALGPHFFEVPSLQTITILTIMASALAMDSPMPPFRKIAQSRLFSVLNSEREPEQMSLGHVGETGYAIFAALSVMTQLAGHEIEECAALVRSLVGEVDLAWCGDEENDM